MVFNKCDVGDNSTRWIETDVEPDLPPTWKKLVCLKDNKPMKKLAKYQDPNGNNFKNLKSAVEAFKSNFHPVEMTLKSSGKRKSLPVQIEEVSPSKRQILEPALNMKISENTMKNQRVPLPSRPHHLIPANRLGNSANFQGQSTIPVSVNPYKCSICIRTGFLDGNEVLKHVKTEHLTCRLCNITFNTMNMMEVHRNDRHGASNVKKKVPPMTTKFQCDLCDQSYQTMEFLNRHKHQDHYKSQAVTAEEPEQFPCNRCNLIFDTSKLVRKHTKKQHVNKLTGVMVGQPSRSAVPPGPYLLPSDGTTFQPGSTSLGKYDIHPCTLCGDEFDNKKLLKKHGKTMHRTKHTEEFSIGVIPPKATINDEGSIQIKVLEDYAIPEDVFEQTDDLDSQKGFVELEENIEFDENMELGQGCYTRENLNTDFDDEDNDDFYEELGGEHNNELDEVKGDYYEDYANADDEDDHQEYYDEQDDIEVISSGIKKLPQLNDDIEVVGVTSNRFNFKEKFKNYSGLQIQKIPQQQQSLNTIQSKYSQITITNNVADISDDEDGDFDDEDYSDFSDDEELDTGVPEEITLDDEPEEVTLDDDDDESEEIIVVKNKKDALEKDNQFKIDNYENMMANAEFVQTLIETPENLQTFKQSAWYAQPLGWKPNKLGEVWNATVSQICFHYKLKDFPLRPDWSFQNWVKFDQFMSPLLENRNPSKPASMVYKRKKAKWFLLMDPVIPEELRVTLETLEGDEV